LVILKPTVSTAVVSSVVTCEKTVVASMCIAGITTAMRVCVNIPLLKTASTALSTSAVNPTVITVDGLDLNTAHTINDYTRQGARLSAVY